MDDQVPESDQPLPVTFWSQPVPATPGIEQDRSMLSGVDKKHASDLQMEDWAPTFELKGLSRDNVSALFGTFSQHMGQELRTYEQIYEHVCMAQIAAEKVVQTDIDPLWIAQHQANAPRVQSAEQQANESAEEATQEQDNTQERKAKRLPTAEMLAKKQAVTTANEVWREAVKNRRAALRQWDNYVNWTHDEFKRLRDS